MNISADEIQHIRIAMAALFMHARLTRTDDVASPPERAKVAVAEADALLLELMK